MPTEIQAQLVPRELLEILILNKFFSNLKV